MMKQYLLLTILVVGIIFISGCIQQQPTTTTTTTTIIGQTTTTIKSTATTTTSTTTTTQPTTNFLTYESSAHGIRLKYPSDWTKTEQIEGNLVAFYSPMESLLDTYREGLGVAVQNISHPMTLDEYTQLSLDQLKQISNTIIIDSSATTLAGSPAHKVVYTGKIELSDKQVDVKFMQVYTIKDNKVYILTYVAEAKKYSKFLGTIQEMVDSFEII